MSGRLTLGRGWAAEIITDDDGDGLIDEDRVELIDNDDDALINEDPAEPQFDNDGDGVINEDILNNLDDDGDGFIDEDPIESFDNDLDGQFDEDGPDPQVDNDGDGLVNEDGLMTPGDDDYDSLWNEDPPDGIDNDEDGLIDEDWDRPVHDLTVGTQGLTTWLRPIKLDSTRNLATLINERFLNGDVGGIVPGKAPQQPFMVVPSEVGFRNEIADPISAAYWAAAAVIARVDAVTMVDGDLFTAFGSAQRGRGGLSMNLMGYYNVNRVVFRPRPSLPSAGFADYWVRYGDKTSINETNEFIFVTKTLVPLILGEFNPHVKDHRFDPPVEMGRLDIISIDPKGKRVETAEAQIFGTGFASDASFISEMIDVGTAVPRFRRYDRQWEQFSKSEGALAAAQFPLDVPGNVVNWGKVRWRGRKIGETDEGDVRIQFRVGNTFDTHLYARRLGPTLVDDRDENGVLLDGFSWLKLTEGRVQERSLQYNEIGRDLGADGELGWSFWSAPFRFEDGLIDDSLPEDQRREAGVVLPLAGGTRFIQFRIIFDSTVESGVALDYLEFDFDVPLVGGGVVAEIFPARVPIGEDVSFRYFVRPFFQSGEDSGFNRLEISVPDANTKIDTVRFDGQEWTEIPVALDGSDDPLLGVRPTRLAPAVGSEDSLGQFAQYTTTDPITGESRLNLKLPIMSREDFQFGENIEVVFGAKLFRGSSEFSASVWNDVTSERATSIPQPAEPGDATPDIATNALTVVVNEITRLLRGPTVSPNPFTPNNDNRNDKVVFDFELFLLLGQVDVTLEIFDLSGGLVRTIGPLSNSAGSVQVEWDGEGDNKELVPPGLYLYRLSAGSDDESSKKTGTIAVAY